MPSLEKFARLAEQVPLFNKLSAEDVAKIYSRGMTMQMEKGNVIFYKGTTGNQMFVVLRGKVSLFDGQKHLADLTAGDMLGEMALISSEPRSATAVAAETTELYVLSETFFQKLLTKRVAIRILLNIIGTLSNRLRSMNTKLTQLQQRQQQ
ncbi:MAG: cyclic nucleotide-binding domain-containing protein [Candidatus Hydrogenedentes bacterium]|nr:cyclic nucleotide-binding domain-containing protein [Candidatus Hydrogenedentota bacterium]